MTKVINWNIPSTFTQGDRITWKQEKLCYDPVTDTAACFIRGHSSPVDLTGDPVADGWIFTLESTESNNLLQGKYKAQVVIFGSFGKQTIEVHNILVRPSFENSIEIETRTPDEIELELITKAIAKLVTGAVAEYRVGDRMMRYQDLEQLTKRQAYLRQRIAIANGKTQAGGRNVPIRFSS